MLPMMNMPQRMGFPPIDLTVGGQPPQGPTLDPTGLGMADMLGPQMQSQNVGTALAPQTQMAPPPNPFMALLDDKAFQMGLLTAGLNMLQPHSPQQTSLGHAAASIGQGVNTMAGVKMQERKNAVEDRRLGFEERKVGQADRQLGQGDVQLQQSGRRVDLDADRVGLEGRRVATGEATAAEEIMTSQQKRAQNEKAFPKTLEKIDAEIGKMVTGGKVDEAQSEFLREKARLYPQEVRADLMRASAAQTTAANSGKPSASEVIFEKTAQAMLKNGDAETIEEAYAALGSPHFQGKGGKAKDEQEEYRKALLAFRSNEGLMLPKGTDLNKYFDENIWNREAPTPGSAPAAASPAPAKPGAKPGAQPAPAAPTRVVSKAEISEAAKRRGVDEALIIKALRERGHKIEGDK